MTLTVIINSLHIGGTERHLLSVLTTLRQRGWGVKVITLYAQGEIRAQLEAEGIPVKALSPAPEVSLFSRICRAFSLMGKLSLELEEGIVHAFLPEASLLTAAVFRYRKMLGMPAHLIISRRSLNHYHTKYPGIQWLEKLLYPIATRLIGNSQKVVDQLREEGWSPEKIALIYNGVDPSAFGDSADLRTELQLPEGAFVIIQVANLLAYKGYKDLLKAFAALVQETQRQDLFLVCVGKDQGIGKDLQAYAKELNIDAQIRWLGQRSDIPALLASADLSVLASHEEGFSNVILESMAAGRPVVATAVGGNGEAILHGVTGLVVPAHHPLLLKEAMAFFVTHPEKARSFGQAGYQRVITEFSHSHCVDQYEALYRSIFDLQEVPCVD